MTGRGRFRASVSRRTRLERMHAHFQDALPHMVPVFLHWQHTRSTVPPASGLDAQAGREIKLRVINHAGEFVYICPDL